MQLVARNISKSFGATQALDNVFITLEDGKVHALVGENGAGKSTLFKVISAHEKRDTGSIMFEGAIYEPLNPQEAQDQGVAMVLQEITINTSLGIAENIFIDRLKNFNNRIGFLKKGELNKAAQAILDEIGSGISVDQNLSDLDLGQWKIIEVARALSLNPKVILLDESTAYLNTQEVSAFLKVINNLRTRGMAIGFVSHHIDEIGKVADLITILKDGKLVGSYKVGELTNEEIEALMVGREIGRDIYPLQAHPEVKGVWCANGGTATGVRAAIKNMGKEPGADIKVVTMDLSPDNVEAMKRGELAFDIGGHWMQGGFALSMMFDYLHGYPVSPEQATVKLKLTALTPDRLSDYERDFPNDWPVYDFKLKSRYYNPDSVISYPDQVKGITKNTNGSRKKITIGAVVPTLDAIFWNRYYEFMQKAADELGVELIRLNADDNSEKLEFHLKSLIDQRVDGIIFVPYWGTDQKCIELSSKAGIPVIFTDVYSIKFTPQSPEAPNYLAFWGPMDEEAGYQMAKHLFEAVPTEMDGKKYIGAIEGTPGTTVAIDRTNGLKRALAEHPEVVLVGEVNGNFVPYQSQLAFASTGWSAQGTGETVLEMKNVTAAGRLNNIDITLQKGEILGIGGLKGSGGEGILEAFIGEIQIDEGEMLFEGRPYLPADPADAWKLGIGYLPGNRSTEGLIIDFSVLENLIMANYPSKGPVLDYAGAKEISDEQISNLRIKTSTGFVACSSLSGGNMQKVVLGKCMAAKPKILLLNNPTRGIDVGARIEIYRIIIDLAKNDVSVILLSEDLPELIGLSNRIVVTRKNGVSKVFSRDERPTEEEIITHMI